MTNRFNFARPVLLSFVMSLTTHAQPVTRPASAPVPPIIQHVHQQRVPHVDKKGQVLTAYDAQRSFFPIGLWGQAEPDAPGGPYPSWKEIADDGFNTVWAGGEIEHVLSLAEKGGVQFVYMGALAP